MVIPDQLSGPNRLNIYDVNKFPPLIESEDCGVEGFFGPYLDKIYLNGYYPVLERRLQGLQVSDTTHIRRIPQIIERIFVPLIQENPDLGDVSLTGEIPRAQATRMHPDYWIHFEQLWNEMEAHQNSKHPLVREFCQSGLGFPHDPDADITFRTVTVEHVSALLRKKFNVDEQKVTHSEGREKYVLFEENGIIVDIDSGPLPTKPDIILMFINICDKSTGERIFHLDVGEFPKSVHKAVKDKRVVNATAKHECQAKLTVVNDHLFYVIPPEVRQVMYTADAIPAKNKSLPDLFELLGRGARIAVSHPVESLIDFEKMLPQFDSTTAFDLQEMFRRYSRKTGEIPNAILFFAIKEWILSFRYDRDQATQMLMDSGFSTYTNLSQLTPFHRDKILRSDAYALEMVNGKQVSDNQRDSAYLRKQRELYLTGHDEFGNRYFGGLKDFITGLVELELLPESALEDVWSAFFDLFVKQPLPQIEITDIPGKPGQIAIISSAAGKKYRVEPVDEGVVTISELEELAAQIVEGVLAFPEGVSPLSNTIMQMQAHAAGDMREAINTWLDFKDKLKISRKDKQTQAEAKNRVYSVAYLLLILQKFSSGLTPKQLSEEYASVRGRFRKLDFSDVFLELKKLGLVTLVGRMRTTMQKRETVPVDIYFALPEGETIHELPSLVPRDGQSDALASFFIHRIQSSGKTDILGKKTVYDVAEMLHDSGISLEALESFTSYDFDKLVEQGMMKTDDRVFTECLRQSLRWYFALRHVSGEAVPYVYNLLFNSFEGKNMLEIVRLALNT